MKLARHLFAGAAALALCGVAAAQEQTINDYVRSLVEGRANPDETLIDLQLEEVEAGDSVELFFDIDPDATYFVYGACDGDCSDLDLSAHDADDLPVDDDDEDDDSPMLLIISGESGDELHVVVDLVDCEAETCVVGVGVYEIGD